MLKINNRAFQVHLKNPVQNKLKTPTTAEHVILNFFQDLFHANVFLMLKINNRAYLIHLKNPVQNKLSEMSVLFVVGVNSCLIKTIEFLN